ncbi:MAG: homoserine kinase [Candidatus Marinimicrobia bacterium]|nr:homoserine kinase [Candidatus Neomarinimicrobiota bacterium]MCF7828370.1 homoserine kinase [Candidatus Neomarinimicrobiota bacterium]MCF7881036.1 homoserine kinase [Candidatus Neomarinimicrobiota bacterium]
MESIRVFAPATVANVAAGFDILGFAVNEPGDEVTIRATGKNQVIMNKIEGDGGKLPTDPMKNTASIAVIKLLEDLESQQGFEIDLVKRMPLGSGMGSSAASSVAAVYATNQLLGAPLTAEELLPFAMEGERIACGAGHADNAAPSLLGGFVLIRSYEPLDVVRIPTPDTLYCSILHPQIEVLTDDARKILKRHILLKDAIVQWGNVAGLMTGLILEDFALVGRSMRDVIIEPVRSLLIPGFDEIKQAAIDAGALGCSISGSGPSLFALSTSEETASNAGKAMQEACGKNDIESEIYVSPINQEGPRILD